MSENNLINFNRSFVTYKKKRYHFNREVTGSELLDIATCVLEKRAKSYGIFFENAKKVSKYLRMQLGHHEREVFACLFLNNKHKLISYEEMFFGTIDTAVVHPREIVKKALLLNASAVVLAHNHPSGSIEPSKSDQQITKKIKEALALVDVRILDHIIVSCDSKSCSFAERGML